MKPLYVINDLHISAIRSGGTTSTTAWQLRQDLLKGLSEVLDKVDSDLVIAGDFADDYRMIAADMLACYHLFCDWLQRGHKVYAMPGNHCLSKSSLDLSSFEMLFRFLEAQHPDQVVLMMQPGVVRDGVYALPHVANQSLMDLELERVPEGTDYLIAHANFSNEFAKHSDHSLDVSEEQIRSLKVKHVLFAHVHQQSTAMKGKVIIIGNQFPSSISDVLGNATKRMAKVTDAGVEFIETWKAEGDYAELDWRALEDTGARFIRAVGTATAEEADQVVTAISRFRQKSTCLVLGNAVKVEGVNDQEDLALTHEQITSFNVRDALRELLTDEENNKIDNLEQPHA